MIIVFRETLLEFVFYNRSHFFVSLVRFLRFIRVKDFLFMTLNLCYYELILDINHDFYVTEDF
jgi:hypothetical protein